MKNLFIIILLMQSFLSDTKPFYLIVHGTWCQPFSWHTPGGDFYDTLVEATETMAVSFFIWSGKHSHQARLKAAEQLIEHIKICLAPGDELNLITHSHGTNVAILASQLLAQLPNHEYYIHHFYALGTPVKNQIYFPGMSVIKYFYNLFSFGDMVQPIFGFFKREFPPHERIANLFITIDGKAPSHTELHSPIVARWLAYLPEKLKYNRIGNFDQFTYEKPGIIHFYTDMAPHYEIDELRMARQNSDKIRLLNLNKITRSWGDLTSITHTDI